MFLKPVEDSPDGPSTSPLKRSASAGENALKARKFVYQELVATEQDYIRDLKTVIDVSQLSTRGALLSTLTPPHHHPSHPHAITPHTPTPQSYYDEMAPEDENSVPLRLRGKRDAIFINLLDIYKFHDW